MVLDTGKPEMKLAPHVEPVLPYRIIRIDPFSEPRWDEFVTKHPGGTIFHHSSWARVLQDRYSTSPCYYGLENHQGKLTAVAPFFLIAGTLKGKRLVCLPCSEYCYPLSYNPADSIRLVDHVKAEARMQNASYIEIRGVGPGDAPSPGLISNPYYLHHIAALEGTPADFRARLSRETRYHLNRGERSSVKIRLAESERDLKEYHRLTSRMRHKINLLPWPYCFFRSIYEHILKPGYGFLVVAEIDRKIVSGGLCLGIKSTLINKFNASDPAYIQLRTNYLVIWKAVEIAYERSYRYFDFGVTNPENEGLARFKGHWNSLQKVLNYYYYPDIRGFSSVPETSLVYRIHTSLNKWLPAPALRLAAQLLYKRLG